MKTKTSSGTCIYCEDPERYDLEPVTFQPNNGNDSPHRVIPSLGYHYEKRSYLRGIPRRRIRCQKSYG